MDLYLKDIIYFSFLIIGVFVGTYQIKDLSDSSRILLALLIITIISETTAEIFRYKYSNNLVVFHIYNPIQYLLFALAFNVELKQNRIIYSSIILYAIFGLINGFLWQPFFDQYCSYSFNVNMILVSSLCLYYLYQLLQQETENHFFDYPLFWISIGYLFYNAANLLGLGAFNSLWLNKDISLILGTVRTLSNYVLYTMFIIAFLSQQKKLIV